MVGRGVASSVGGFFAGEVDHLADGVFRTPCRSGGADGQASVLVDRFKGCASGHRAGARVRSLLACGARELGPRRGAVRSGGGVIRRHLGLIGRPSGGGGRARRPSPGMGSPRPSARCRAARPVRVASRPGNGRVPLRRNGLFEVFGDRPERSRGRQGEYQWTRPHLSVPLTMNGQTVWSRPSGGADSAAVRAPSARSVMATPHTPPHTSPSTARFPVRWILVGKELA